MVSSIVLFKTMVIIKLPPFVLALQDVDLFEGRVIRLGETCRFGIASRVNISTQTVTVRPHPWSLPVVGASGRSPHRALGPMISERFATTYLLAISAAVSDKTLFGSFIRDCLHRTCVAFASRPDNPAVVAAIHKP